MVVWQAHIVAFLELIFVLVALMLLHRLRPVLGQGAYFMGLATVLVFAQFVSATGLELYYPPSDESIFVSQAIFFTPFLAALLITYIVDGTLAAQQLIWGTMTVVGIFFYLTYLGQKQVEMPGYQIGQDPQTVATLYQLSRGYILATLLSLLVEFLALPVVYEILRGRNFGLAVCVFIALIFTQVLDAFFFELVTNPGSQGWWNGLRHSFGARAVAMTIVAGVTTMYLHMRDAPATHESSARRPTDILMAFLGGYGLAEQMRANLREWEGRYRMVVENTNDLIFIVDRDGRVLDANDMARRASGYPIAQLVRQRIGTLISFNSPWEDIWERLDAVPGSDGQTPPPHVMINECRLHAQGGTTAYLETVISPLRLQNHDAALFVGRDISQRKHIEEERLKLQETLIHAQRMEAVGKLAAGIAHDFNNLLHAIQGSIDNLARQIGRQDPGRPMLENIENATNRAATLTQQLLGFARAGKYELRRLAVAELVRETESLIRPTLGKNVELKVAVHPDPMFVRGDFTQLQQVLFNVLLNARDAIPADRRGRLVFRAEPANEHHPGWAPERVGAGDTDAFVVIRVRDNGIGMDEETRKHIFEPFFTTKETQGTGMGLAMAYGCVDGHNGWIHVVSEPGKGSEFHIFLPRVD